MYIIVVLMFVSFAVFAGAVFTIISLPIRIFLAKRSSDSFASAMAVGLKAKRVATWAWGAGVLLGIAYVAVAWFSGVH